MTDLDVRRVQVSLRVGQTVAEIAEAEGVSVRTLLRRYQAATGLSLQAWRTAQGISTGEGSAEAVFFRLPEYRDLASAAENDDTTPNEWARNAVQRALAVRGKKK